MSQLDPHTQPQAAPRGLRTAGIAAAVVAAVVVVYGLVSRVHGTEQMRDWTQQQALPVVAVGWISPSRRVNSSVETRPFSASCSRRWTGPANSGASRARA